MVIGASKGIISAAVAEALVYFNKIQYEGNGTGQSITTNQDLSGNGWLLWFKETNTVSDHSIIDSSRGIGTVADGVLRANADIAAGQLFPADIESLNSDGFSLGSYFRLNNNATDFVVFSWLKSAGFCDVVEYTGNGSDRSIAHSLGVTPSMYIIKEVDGVDDWYVWWDQLGTPFGERLELNTADASLSGVWGSGTVDSSTFAVAGNNAVNDASKNYMAYLFAELTGFSATGVYTGQGSSTPTSVTGLGFTPKSILIKRDDGVESWILAYDDNGSNPAEYVIPDSNAAATTNGGAITIDSDGFTLNAGTANANDGTYLYFAWG